MKQNDITELATLESSRLEKLFNIYQTEEGIYFYNLLNTINFDANNIAPYIYNTYTVMTGDTYTFISYKHYQTINLWWLICAFNNIKDPTKLPIPGTYIKILDSEYVVNVLTQIDGA